MVNRCPDVLQWAIATHSNLNFFSPQNSKQEEIWDAAIAGDKDLLQKCLIDATVESFGFEKKDRQVRLLFDYTHSHASSYNSACFVNGRIIRLARLLPLGVAAYYGHTDVASMLMKAGSHVNY
jgi:hypothetical protein